MFRRKCPFSDPYNLIKLLVESLLLIILQYLAFPMVDPDKKWMIGLIIAASYLVGRISSFLDN